MSLHGIWLDSPPFRQTIEPLRADFINAAPWRNSFGPRPLCWLLFTVMQLIVQAGTRRHTWHLHPRRVDQFFHQSLICTEMLLEWQISPSAERVDDVSPYGVTFFALKIDHFAFTQNSERKIVPFFARLTYDSITVTKPRGLPINPSKHTKSENQARHQKNDSAFF